MCGVRLSRRHLLTLPLALMLGPVADVVANGESRRRSTYEIEVDILYNALRYRLVGGIDELVDRAGGRYEVRLEGEGTGFANRGESSGLLRDGRWVPLHTGSWVHIAGRDGTLDITYDHDRRVAQYRSRSETFFLGRLRVVDDVVPIPAGIHIDDMASAFLNHADGRWRAEPGGDLETRMVRRQRDRREGVEEISGTHRAEIVPVTLKLATDAASGKRIALLDLTRLSSWALEDKPAQIVFGADGRPEVITSRLMFGTLLTIRFAAR